MVNDNKINSSIKIQYAKSTPRNKFLFKSIKCENKYRDKLL